MIDLDTLKFDGNGLIGAIAQDNGTGEVLMFAFMNREALEKTIETGIAHYWSRSRQKLWKKVASRSSAHERMIASIVPAFAYILSSAVGILPVKDMSNIPSRAIS